MKDITVASFSTEAEESDDVTAAPIPIEHLSIFNLGMTATTQMSIWLAQDNPAIKHLRAAALALQACAELEAELLEPGIIGSLRSMIDDHAVPWHAVRDLLKKLASRFNEIGWGGAVPAFAEFKTLLITDSPAAYREAINRTRVVAAARAAAQQQAPRSVVSRPLRRRSR
jgi:hypothetical protein